MKYVITDEMRRVRETKSETISSIQFELYRQKYGRPPTIVEFFDMDDEIRKIADLVFLSEFVEKYGLKEVI